MTAPRLTIVAPLGAGESPTSFVSRLAAANFIDDPRKFCADLEISLQGVVDGKPDALSTIAWAAGVSSDLLSANALCRIGISRDHTLRGERIARTSLSRERFRVCPMCVRDDVRSTDAPADIAIYGRTLWLLSSIRTCPAHSTALVEVTRDNDLSRTHDFSRMVRQHLGGDKTFTVPSTYQDVSSLEHYLLARLERAQPASPFLDSLEFHAAARTCEVLGAVAAFGPNCTHLGDPEWHVAGQRGFDIAQHGAPAIREFLSDLQNRFQYNRSGKEGAKSVFGRFYRALSTYDHAAYKPVRALVAKHIMETMPLAAGDDIFGHVVEERSLHSIRTASVQARMNPLTLRRILLSEAVISDADSETPDNMVTFPANAADNIVDRLTGALRLTDVADYLNIGRRQTTSLLNAGILKPINKRENGRTNHLLFSQSEIDGFLAKLVQKSSPVIKLEDGMASLINAGFQTNAAINLIVQLILENKLTWVGHMAEERGFSSVIINVPEVTDILFGQLKHEIPLSDVAKELRVIYPVICQLIEAGLLPFYEATLSKTKKRRKVALRTDVDFLKNEFFTLPALARWRGVRSSTMQKMLDAVNIRPAFQPRSSWNSFYRRADLPPRYLPHE